MISRARDTSAVTWRLPRLLLSCGFLIFNCHNGSGDYRQDFKPRDQCVIYATIFTKFRQILLCHFRTSVRSRRRWTTSSCSSCPSSSSSCSADSHSWRRAQSGKSKQAPSPDCIKCLKVEKLSHRQGTGFDTVPLTERLTCHFIYPNF